MSTDDRARAHELVVEAAEDSRVVLVVGPRQAGKTTLVRDLADGSLPRSYVTMDAASVRRTAAEDPSVSSPASTCRSRSMRSSERRTYCSR